MKICFCAFSLLCTAVVSAQNEVSTIYWGNTILDFRSLPFQVLSTTAVDSRESAASICDANGNLLFYSNGGTSPLSPNQQGGAWGANGQYLQNGQNLSQLGCFSSQQGAIILPDPAGISPTSKKYYLLTRDCVEAAVNGNGPDNSGFSYGVIDMLANGGAGAVISQNNVVVPYLYNAGHSTDLEPINVVLDVDGEQKSTAGYWVFSYVGDSLYKIHFGVNGFDSFQKLFPESGIIIVAPDRNHLIIRERLYDLDAPIGSLQLIHTFASGGYSAFSPDGRKLYRQEGSQLKQYDLDQQNWQNTPYILASFSQQQYVFPLLVPSGRILICTGNMQIDGEIVCPNNAGAACGYDPTPLSLQGGTIEGIPNIPAHYLYSSNTTCRLELSGQGASAFNVVPNPSEGNVKVFAHVSGLSELNIRVIDLTGRILRTEVLSTVHGEDYFEVRREDLQNGEYLLELQLEGKEPVVKRFMLQ